MLSRLSRPSSAAATQFAGRRLLGRTLALPRSQGVVDVAPHIQVRAVFDHEGYDLPFGKSQADRKRDAAQEKEKQEGVTVVLPNTARAQWHPPLTAALDEFELYESQAPHALELRRARMGNMRMLLENVPIEPPEEDPFYGYFKKRDGDADTSGEPLATVAEVEVMLMELVEMQFPAENEEAMHVAGSVMEEEEKPYEIDTSISAAAEKRFRKEARQLKDQINAGRSHGQRAPFVSDEIERKLLICVCLQALTRRLSQTDEQKNILQRTTYIDPRTGRSPTSQTKEAYENPTQFMRYGHEDTGTEKAFKILEYILESEAEQHYEAIRYHAELAVTSGQLWRLSDSFRLAKGFALPSQRDPDYKEACQEVCEEIIANVTSEWFMRSTHEHLLHAGGEGAAARAFLDRLKDTCHIIGERPSGIVIETVVDDVSALLTAAASQDGSAPGLQEYMPSVETQSSLFTLGLQSATAMLKTLVGTELPLVVDPHGVLQFTCYSRLYAALMAQRRVHESWGTAEAMLSFYDEYAPVLEADFKAQKRLFAEQVKEMTGQDMDNLVMDKDDSNEGMIVYRKLDEEKGLTTDVGDLPDQRESPYSAHMRLIHLEYLGERLRESAIFGRRVIEDALKTRYNKHPEAWKLMSIAFLKTGQPDEAIAAAHQAIFLNPSDPHPHVLLAAYYWDKKQYLSAKRESRLAELVEDAVNAGRDISAADLQMAASSMELLDERREVLKQQQTDQLREDGWSHKFFNREQRVAVDALVEPEVEAGTALLPPMTADIIKELSKVRDDPGDEEYQDWVAHMSWVNRYSKAISRPRAAKDNWTMQRMQQEQDHVWRRENIVPPEELEPVPDPVY